MVNAAVSSTMAERLEELGHISAERLRLSPAPGTATLHDLMEANTHHKPLCELIDQTLVEKAVGFEASRWRSPLRRCFIISWPVVALVLWLEPTECSV